MTINDNVAVKSAAINPNSTGANTLVAAIPNLRIRVVGGFLVSTSANIVTFTSDTTAISGAMPFAANGGMVLPYNRWGWFTTETGELLGMNLSTSAIVGTTINYEVIK